MTMTNHIMKRITCILLFTIGLVTVKTPTYGSPCYNLTNAPGRRM